MLSNKSLISRLLMSCLFLYLVLILPACNKSSDTEPEKATSAQIDSSSSEESIIDWPDKYESTNVRMELQKLSEHAYFVEGPPGAPTDHDGFMSNAGVVVTDEGVVVFDALGTPSLGYKLFTEIRKITDKQVVKVIVSHYHADHIYGLQVFKEMGAEIIAPVGAKEYLASDAAEGRLKERRESLFPWVNEDTYIVHPDGFIDKDTSFQFGGIDFDIILLGAAHSQGDLMLRVNSDKVLFAGDLIFEGRIPFVAGSSFNQWSERLASLETENLDIVVPGHGGMSTNPKQALGFTSRYIAYLSNSMGDAVENLVSFDEAYSGMDWSSYEKLPAFQVNRINAYYVYLQLEAASMQ